MRSVQNPTSTTYKVTHAVIQVRRWNLIVACGMLKPAYFAFVKTMLEFFWKLHILLNHEHIRHDQQAK